MDNIHCKFSLQAVRPDEVFKVITALKNSKSTGTDNIDTFIIKLVAQDILAPLINTSILTATFSSSWKHAKVVPLLKKGDPLIAKKIMVGSIVTQSDG